MVPDDAKKVAADLGATKWQILRMIEIPLKVWYYGGFIIIFCSRCRSDV